MDRPTFPQGRHYIPGDSLVYYIKNRKSLCPIRSLFMVFEVGSSHHFRTGKKKKKDISIGSSDELITTHHS